MFQYPSFSHFFKCLYVCLQILMVYCLTSDFLKILQQYVSILFNYNCDSQKGIHPLTKYQKHLGRLFSNHTFFPNLCPNQPLPQAKTCQWINVVQMNKNITCLLYENCQSNISLTISLSIMWLHQNVYNQSTMNILLCPIFPHLRTITITFSGFPRGHEW